jgi:hypothetical protein
MPLFIVETTYIIAICVIEEAVHLHPLMQQLDSLWWYLSNTIDLNTLHLLYMESFQSDA